MHTQLEDAEGQLASAHADLALKEDDNQLVSEAMAKKDEELQTVQVRLQEVCNLLEKTEDQIGGLEQQEIELRNQIKALENDTVKKTHECDSTLWECKKQQEEISTLRALVRRGNDEKARLEKEIQEVQASLGTAHRELRQREDEVNAIAEQVRQQKEEKGEVKNSVIQELKVRHEADIADIQRVCAEGVEELKRMNENTITALKAEHTSKMSDMRAKLQYEVENKTLELKLKLSERNTDLDTAKKQHADIESGLRSSVKELEATLAQTTKEAEEKEKAAKTREVELKGDVEIKTAEMKAMRLSMEEEIATLEKDGAGKLMTIDTLQADLEEAQKLVEESEMKLKEHIANAAREREEKQRELEEKEAQREKERKELEMERERERKERENERDQGMNEIETMKGDSHEKDAIIDKYTALVEDLRSEVEMTRTELLRSEEDRMKVQEDNVMTRGLMRRKEEERQKLESENIKLLEFINHKDQEIGGKDDKIQKLLFEHQAELNAKQDILERLKAEQLELETQISTEREQHKEEQTTMERQHKENTEGLVQRSDHEKRELLREVEQRNLELAQRSKDTSCFLVEIEKLKVELAHAHRDKDDHERNIELRDQELIDFKGKHVSIVEALQIDLRKSEEEVARLLPLLEDLQDQLGSHQEEVGMLRSKEQTWQQELKVKEHTWQQELKEWADKHHVNTDQVRTKEQAIARLESELDSAQEQATILEKQMQDLNDDLEREVASHKTLKEELVMLRGEVRRKGDEMKKMEESQGSLHNSTMERTAAHQDEMEGLWRAMTRKDEEIAELKKASWDAKSKHEDLQKEVEKLSVEAEDKQKRMKELQAMVRGKAQLEKQGVCVGVSVCLRACESVRAYVCNSVFLLLTVGDTKQGWLIYVYAYIHIYICLFFLHPMTVDH